MKLKSIFALLFVVAIFVLGSCKKDDTLTQKTDVRSNINRNARLNANMTNEEMEAEITGFIEKLENPEGQPDMNIDEAFEDIEATLNYKYVNYDFSKCANSVTFTGTLSISPDANNMMSMSSISIAYDSILSDWSTKYHSVNEDIKTPIVFDITDISSSEVKYMMVVGKGSLDLRAYSTNLVVPSSIFHSDGAYYIQNQILNYINNDNISLGGRTYFTFIGMQWLGPKGILNSNDPMPADGYIDYQYFYTNKSEQGYHLFWHQFEYNYYKDSYFDGLTDFISSIPNVNATSYYHIGIDYTGPVYNPNANPPTLPDILWHTPQVFYGRRYIAINGLSSL